MRPWSAKKESGPWNSILLLCYGAADLCSVVLRQSLVPSTLPFSLIEQSMVTHDEVNTLVLGRINWRLRRILESHPPYQVQFDSTRKDSTMKIGFSPVYEENRLLRQELEEKKAEIAALKKESKAEITALKEELKVFRRRYPRPSYMRPVDGQEAKARRGGFDQPTQASLNRMKANLKREPEQSDLDTEVEDWKDETSPWDLDQDTGAVDDADVDDYDKDKGDCACKYCAAIVAEERGDREPTSLHERTRLRDDSFYSCPRNPAKNIHLPFREQYRQLRSAYSLAQAALWHALRKHWPEAQRRCYLEGPSTVRFGRSELEDCFGTGRYPSQQNAMCDLPPSEVYSKIVGVVPLRNAICHPRAGHGVKDLDFLMKEAQYLCVTLLDEPRAMQIRALRDGLQKRARQEFDEIEKFALLGQLPKARNWALHHQIFFDRAKFWIQSNERGAIEAYGALVVRAIQSWVAKCPQPGVIDPEYLALVERKRAEIQRIKDQVGSVGQGESRVEP